MADALISIAGLCKKFGPFTAVDGLSFSVARGEVLGFLGPNGAGKSTTMKMITGFLAPTAGRVVIDGFDGVRERLSAQRRIGYLPEGAPAYGDMTPRQYLKFIADVRRLKKAEAASAIERAVSETDLSRVFDQPIETLSKGFKRRVGLAQAILNDPPVLVLDEPTDGLDPNQKHAVRKLIASMAASKAIIISTHILEEVEAVCSRALIIDRGKIVADGTPSELMARSAYHQAVTITLSADHAGLAAPALEALPSVASVAREPVPGTHGAQVALTAFPEGSASLLGVVSGLAAANGWAVEGLYAEKGRLDEVFRTLTHSDIEPAQPGGASKLGRAA